MGVRPEDTYLQNWMKTWASGSETDPVIQVGQEGRVREAAKLATAKSRFRIELLNPFCFNLILKVKAVSSNLQKLFSELKRKNRTTTKKNPQFPDLAYDTLY